MNTSKKTIKSIKSFVTKAIKNGTAIKGGTDLIPIRAPRYKGGRG
ncbi:MAG: hypothetical protein ACI8ZM_004433 [Crocinitomix sp.]|jgi:hypothetical protein